MREILDSKHKIIELIEERPLGWSAYFKRMKINRIQNMILPRAARERESLDKSGWME